MKNQVWQTGVLVYFEFDFCCLCSLQKSSLKSTKVKFVEPDFSKNKYRSTVCQIFLQHDVWPLNFHRNWLRNCLVDFSLIYLWNCMLNWKEYCAWIDPEIDLKFVPKLFLKSSCKSPKNCSRLCDIIFIKRWLYSKLCMGWHISSWLFTKLDDFLQFVCCLV